MKMLFIACLFVSHAAFAQLKVGMVLPLTGSFANTGNDIVQGTKAMVDVFNAAGGVPSGAMKGQKIELVIEDDKFDAAQSELLSQKLIKERGVVAMLSCFGTVSCLSVAKVSQETGVPLIGPIAGAEVLRKTNNTKVYAFRANATQEVGALISYLKGIGQTSAAIVIQDDPFGRSYAASFKTASESAGFSAAQTVMLDPKNPQYQEVAKALVASKTSSIILITNTLHSIGVIKALNTAQYFGMVLNLAAQANGGFVKSLAGGKQIAVFSTMTPSPFASGVQAAVDYRAHYAKLALPLSYLSFEAFLNAKLLTEAAKRMNKNNADGFDRALQGLSNIEVAGIQVNFSGGRRQGASFTDLAVMTNDGRFRQ